MSAADGRPDDQPNPTIPSQPAIGPRPPVLKNVTIALAFLIVAVFLYVGYNSYASRRHLTSNEVYSGSAMAPDPENRSGASARSADLPATLPTGNSSTSETTANGAATAGSMVPPTSDSIRPDPPNGMTFGGSGQYQLYRQGNLTWRLDTATGDTCIIFATEEEWRKPQVARAGCRGH